MPEKRSYMYSIQRKAQIVEMARNLFDEKGIHDTSIQDICRAAGVSRSTFYCCFPDKKSLYDAVEDDYISSIAESLELWEGSRAKGKNFESIRSSIKLIKMIISDRSALRAQLTKEASAQEYIDYTANALNRIMKKLDGTTIKYYAQHHHIEIGHLPETFYILIAGLVVYLRTHPDADVDVLATVAAQTLHIPIEESH